MHKKTEFVIRKVLHFLEGVIAIMTLIVMVGMVVFEVYKMFTMEGYFGDVHNYLHNILTIVVGLEFVRMLIDMTPANTLEVLIVAIARQVIISHDNPLSNVACVLCIAGLFATRRFLIPRSQMTIEMSEVEPEEDEKEENVHH
ncbi:MAG: hypothetical protein J6V34_05065 [Oscillospiraceae bacterium]|nr:hypothetical protein [Oscillospiraceae bacterium]